MGNLDNLPILHIVGSLRLHGNFGAVNFRSLDIDCEIRYHLGMTDTEQLILDELIGLETALANLQADPKPDLVGIFKRIDDLTGQLPKNGDPELLHFLHKKSYEKARFHLQGRSAENARGTCH